MVADGCVLASADWDERAEESTATGVWDIDPTDVSSRVGATLATLVGAGVLAGASGVGSAIYGTPLPLAVL